MSSMPWRGRCWSARRAPPAHAAGQVVEVRGPLIATARRPGAPRSATRRALNGTVTRSPRSSSASAPGGPGAAATRRLDGDALWDACRAQARPRLDDLAQRIEPARGLGRPRPARARSCRRCARSPRTSATGTRVYERLGLRRAEQPRARHQRAVRRRRAAPARRWPPRCSPTSCASTSTASTSAPVVSKYIGETEKNLRRRLRRGRGGRRDPALRRGRRAVRQAQRGQGQPRPLRQHRGQLPAAADGGLPRPRDPDHQPEGARSTRRSCAGIRFVVQLPVPGRRAARREIWRRIFPAETPTDGLDADAARAAQRRRRQHPQHRAQRRVPRRRTRASRSRMAHLRRRRAGEYAKLERPLTDAEMRGWT